MPRARTATVLAANGAIAVVDERQSDDHLTANEDMAAKMRALCWSRTEICRALNIEPTTYAKYALRKPYQRAVRQYMAEAQQVFDDQFQELVENAMRVVNMALAGEIEADDPRIPIAQDALAQTAYKVVVQRAHDQRTAVAEAAQAGYIEAPAAAG